MSGGEARPKPLPGHKHIITQMKFETYCECGWISCPHEKRAEAYSEWRAHVQGHRAKQDIAA